MIRKPTPSRLAIALTAIAAVIALAVVVPAGAHRDHRSGDDPAGTIASFNPDNGKLTIDLSNGGSVSGVVTRRTWIDSGEDCDGDRRALHGWCRVNRSGSDHSDHDHDWDHGPDGDVEDLVEGAVVDDALLVLTDGRAVFAKIELED
jgi:hypothetical protein